MNKPWRERIAAARERGAFTPEDYEAIQDYPTCMVGEASVILGDCAWRQHESLARMGLNTPWPNWVGPLWCVFANLFDLAEDRLDAIEDEVLRIKREREETHV